MLIFGKRPVPPPSTGTEPKKNGPWQKTLAFSVFSLLSVWVCVKITHSNRWHTVGWAGAFLLGSQAPFGFPGPHMGCGRALKGAGSYSISVQPTPSPSASNHFCTQFCQPTGNGDSRGAKKMCFGLQFSVASEWTFFHCEAKFTKWLTIWQNTSWMVDDIAAEMCSMNPHSGESGVKILWCTFRRDSPSFFFETNHSFDCCLL